MPDPAPPIPSHPPGQYAAIQADILAAVRRVLESGEYILGREARAFEQEWATYVGNTHAVAVASGTDALCLALLAGGVRPGDEVITVSHTAVAVAAAVEQAGARPVFVDIDPLSYTLDPARIEAAITTRTRAVVPVHLYGCPADLEHILLTASQRSLLVVEDCAQAHGAIYRGRRVGSWGALAAFSFYPTKNLGAFGDGGMVVTGSESMAVRLRQLRQYGWGESRISQVKGYNSRLDEIQAAVLRVKLEHLEEWNRCRRDLAAAYSCLLRGLPGLQLPVEPALAVHVYHQFVIRHPRRDDLQAHLARAGITTLVHYPVPVHLQPAYAGPARPPGSLPETERAAREVLSLPIDPGMTLAQVEQVCAAVRAFG